MKSTAIFHGFIVLLTQGSIKLPRPASYFTKEKIDFTDDKFTCPRSDIYSRKGLESSVAVFNGA